MDEISSYFYRALYTCMLGWETVALVHAAVLNTPESQLVIFLL